MKQFKNKLKPSAKFKTKLSQQKIQARYTQLVLWRLLAIYWSDEKTPSVAQRARWEKNREKAEKAHSRQGAKKRKGQKSRTLKLARGSVGNQSPVLCCDVECDFFVQMFFRVCAISRLLFLWCMCVVRIFRHIKSFKCSQLMWDLYKPFKNL